MNQEEHDLMVSLQLTFDINIAEYNGFSVSSQSACWVRLSCARKRRELAILVEVRLGSGGADGLLLSLSSS